MSISWWCLRRRGLIWLAVYNEANNHYQKISSMPSVKWFVECFFFGRSTKKLFAVPSAKKKTLSKKTFGKEASLPTLDKEALLPSVFLHSTKTNFKAHFEVVN
jgi:hypothetical protein